MYEKKIEIYRIIDSNFVSPLAVAPETLSYKHAEGDFLLIIDDEVWIKNIDEKEDNYSLAVYSSEFVRINKSLFEKL